VPTVTDAGANPNEQREAELRAELEKIERERREAERQQQEERRLEAEAALDPEKRALRDEIERRAKEALDREWPPSWQPHKAESGHPHELVGIVLRIDPRVGPSAAFGTYSAVIELKATDEHKWTIWANEGGVLHAQLLRQRVQPGELVGVRYLGKKPSQANPDRSYQDYRLARVTEDDAEPELVDYDALQRQHGEPAALPPPAEQPDPDDDIPF
jgi:hypothetical protein